MTRLNESPKDNHYAYCDELGYEEVKKQVENDDFSGFSDKRYVISWYKKETEKIRQEKRMDATANSAKLSAIASVLSAMVALLALLLKFTG
jgi:hypothetical protein